MHIIGKIEIVVHGGRNNGLAAGREEGTVDRFAGLLDGKGLASGGRLVSYLGRLELAQVPQFDGTIETGRGQDVAVRVETYRIDLLLAKLLMEGNLALATEIDMHNSALGSREEQATIIGAA